MSESLHTFRVFIASPNDLNEERKAIKEVVDSLNKSFVKAANWHIQLLGWEDTLPGVGRPQALINEEVDKADLFIGFLWKRWGTPTNHENYSSGFDEEFHRALARKNAQGVPEVSLYFKELDAALMSEPDEHLKKVLAFKDDLVKTQKLFFKEFKTIEDWKERILQLLTTHLLQLFIKSNSTQFQNQPQQPSEGKSSERIKFVQRQSQAPSVARQQIVELWNETGSAIGKGDLLGLDKSNSFDTLKVARLGLVTLSIVNRDIEGELIGVHLNNILFKNRKEITLSGIEKLLVLKTNLCSNEVGPGWFWLKKWKIKIETLLFYLACNDNNSAVRREAFSLAADAKLPLLKKSRNGKSVIARLCADEDAEVRKSGVEYLALNGTEKDLPLAQTLLADADNGVRTQSEQAVRSIQLRKSAANYFTEYILNCSSTSDEILSELKVHISTLDTTILRRALQHPDPKIRVFAATGLALRAKITAEEINALNLERPVEVWEAYYKERIDCGVIFKPDEIRRNLSSTLMDLGFTSSKSANADAIILKLFKLYSFEELLSIVEEKTADSPFAYQILGEMHFEKIEVRLRDDLNTEFAWLDNKSKAGETSFLPSTAVIWNLFNYSSSLSKSDFIKGALLGLTLNAKSSDRNLFLKFIENTSSAVELQSIKGLEKTGTEFDAERLLEIAAANKGQLSYESLRVAIILSPSKTGIARKLLQSNRPQFFLMGVMSLFEFDSEKIWPLFKDRLYDENEEIRKIVVAYAVVKHSVKKLEKILNWYLFKDRYFYNVVFYFDRAIYAPPTLRKIFRRKIEEFLRFDPSKS